jgi:hypothetical protein
VLLGDPGVPPQAARLIPSGGGFLLEDLSGSVKVNGTSISSPFPLQSGDKISIASAILVYQGPSAPPAALSNPPPAKPVTPSLSPMVVPNPPPPPSVPSVSGLGFALKQWQEPPQAEGWVELLDGPYRMEKGSFGGKVALSIGLSMIDRNLGMLPFFAQREVNVWFLRVKDISTNKIISIVMRGEPGGLPQLGDFVAIWGKVKDGNILMEGGYNYTTDSQIPLKR